MNDYLLMFRREERPLTQAEQEQMMASFLAWAGALRKEGVVTAIERLKPSTTGRTLRQKPGGVVIDGPYTEAKEAIVGFFMVKAPSVEAAAAIARGCPILAVGGTVEVRETDFFPKK
jgi:hypothetical protein